MVVIVVSGMPGAGSSTIAKMLAKWLGMKHFSAGDFFKKKAEENGVEEKETRRATKFLQSDSGSRKDFHVNIDNLQRELAKEGNIVIEGKLSIHMLEGLYDVSVWLKASQETRARRISGRDNLVEKDAISVIKERDRIERESFLKIYGFDTFSQEQKSNIIVDTSNKTPEQIVDIIIKKMNMTSSSS